ncbi:Uncharacterised protein [Mycobacteroides abscessus subsp. abscessus]|nr:Uncharacterised protein [Mycobacteroides abscessus subsp. abscessus]
MGRELVGVLEALHVAARPGVAVPVPGAADVASGFVNACIQPYLTHLMQHLQTGEPGADDDHIEVSGHVICSRAGRWIVGIFRCAQRSCSRG